MTRQTARQLALPLLLATVLGLALVLDPVHVAVAQDAHDAHSEGKPSISRPELLGGLAHAATLASVTLLAGLTAFVPSVWLPVHRTMGEPGTEGTKIFVRFGWALFGTLVAAGIVELSLYAVRASGEDLSLGLFWQTLRETRVGGIWLARLGTSLLVVLVATWTLRGGGHAYWWVAATLGTVPLLTLTLLSHAAAEERFLPFFADWAHVSRPRPGWAGCSGSRRSCCGR